MGEYFWSVSFSGIIKEGEKKADAKTAVLYESVSD